MGLINGGASENARSGTAGFARSRPSKIARSGAGPGLSLFHVERVDVGLALAAPGDGQEAIGLKRLEVLAHVGLVQAHVVGKPLLSGIAVVVLPCVAEQHGERELVAGAQFLRLKQEVRDLGEAAARRGVGAAQDDVAILEDVANVAFLAVLHATIIRCAMPRIGESPTLAVESRRFSAAARLRRAAGSAFPASGRSGCWSP